MMEIMIKLILQTTQLTRDISSIVFDVFLVPVASKFVLLATQQGGRYARATSVAGHGLGPPQIYVLAALLTYLAERDGATSVGAANLTSSGTFTFQEKSKLVRMCKVGEMFNQEFKKTILVPRAHAGLLAPADSGEGSLSRCEMLLL